MSWMRDETLGSADCAATFLQQGMAAALSAGAALRERAILHLDVLGRGSSSHAGTVLRYAIAAQGGLSVAAAMPSLASNERALAHMRQGALVAISQSGQSPDLVRFAAAARAAGAYVVALTNTSGSPLGASANIEVPLCAGAERSIAATKTVIMSMLASLALVAGYRRDDRLIDSLRRLPERLGEAAGCDWSALGRTLLDARAVYLVGRGVDLGIAKELALKISETLGIPGLAFSSAEFLHGPLGAVSAQTPVIGLCSDGHTMQSVRTALEHARALGAPTLLAHGQAAATGMPASDLPLPAAQDSLVDCMLMLVPAYLAIEAAAVAAGRDPDQPRGLSKVTETL